MSEAGPEVRVHYLSYGVTYGFEVPGVSSGNCCQTRADADVMIP